MKNEVTAKRLLFALNRKGIKAQDLADRSGLNKASISQYINGTHAPSNLSAGKMASILGVSPVWLMGFDVPMLDPSMDSVPIIDAETLSSHESRLIRAYRAADQLSKDMVHRILGLDQNDAVEDKMA